MFATKTLPVPVRVRTSSGEAQFIGPKGVELSAELAGQWIDLPKGTEIAVCAKFEKTDTFMLAVTQPATTDEETGEKFPAIMNGVVLRRKSFQKLMEAEIPVVDEAETQEEAAA